MRIDAQPRDTPFVIPKNPGAIVSLRQNGVGTGFSIADAILPKMFIRDAHHRE